MRIRWISVLISFLIVACGWLGSQTLLRVDQNLRVIYTEYTLAATDLGHVSGELIRYRTSVIRAIEAERKEDFQRIVTSLPRILARLNSTMERFIEAANDTSFEKKMDARELAELRAVQERIEAYISASRRPLELMTQRWNVVSPVEAQHLQNEAKEYLAKDAGTKYMSVTLELDRLLEVVGTIAGEVRKEADSTIRIVTVILVVISIVLGLLVLAIPTGAK
jgi:Four helix bundle sensory module for signal transduction